jgi:hypothetical protein
MKIETTFAPGDTVWCTGECGVPRQLTVGQIRVVLTDSPGCDLGDGIPWDNYKPRKEFVEELMCVETGVGSGSVFTVGKHAFKTEFECQSRIEQIALQSA